MAALQSFRGVDPRDAELADQIVPDASVYLDQGELRAIIRADFTEAHASELIAAQKIRLRRYVKMLPGVFGLLRPENVRHAISLLQQIDDCCRDVPLISKAPRRDKSERLLIEKFQSATRSLTTAISELKALRSNFDIEYDHFRDAYDALLQGRSSDEYHSANFHFADLLKEMQFSLNCLHIVQATFTTDKSSLFIQDNQVKKHIVECAYHMARWGGGPPLVTTPASDFSVLCSLLYEIATGDADESLAGAINRFSRSDERREFDEGEVEDAEFDNDSAPDNFYAQKNRIKGAKETIERYQELLDARQLPDDAEALVLALMRRAADQAAAAEAEYGPNIIWAHQISKSDWEKQQARHHEMEEQMRTLDIQLGDSIRGLQKLRNRPKNGD